MVSSIAVPFTLRTSSIFASEMEAISFPTFVPSSTGLPDCETEVSAVLSVSEFAGSPGAGWQAVSNRQRSVPIQIILVFFIYTTIKQQGVMGIAVHLPSLLALLEIT